jgi:phosphohistidine phosphatase
MKVWVLRHGEAHPQAATDEVRELTEGGRAQVVQSARHLHEVSLDAILASPYVRTQQTAALVREALGRVDPVTTVQWLTPDQDPQDVATQLEKLGLENVLLVSHQPLVGTLISVLESGRARHDHPMGTASLAELEGEWPRPGLMHLRSLRHAVET